MCLLGDVCCSDTPRVHRNIAQHIYTLVPSSCRTTGCTTGLVLAGWPASSRENINMFATERVYTTVLIFAHKTRHEMSAHVRRHAQILLVHHHQHQHIPAAFAAATNAVLPGCRTIAQHRSNSVNGSDVSGPLSEPGRCSVSARAPASASVCKRATPNYFNAIIIWLIVRADNRGGMRLTGTHERRHVHVSAHPRSVAHSIRAVPVTHSAPPEQTTLCLSAWPPPTPPPPRVCVCICVCMCVCYDVNRF